MSFLTPTLLFDPCLGPADEWTGLSILQASTILSRSVPLCVCLSVCAPFFRHDRQIATTFDTHMRIDPGIIRSQTNVTHLTPGVSQGGGFSGSNIQKSGKCHELPRKSIKQCNPHPTPPHPTPPHPTPLFHYFHFV